MILDFEITEIILNNLGKLRKLSSEEAKLVKEYLGKKRLTIISRHEFA